VRFVALETLASAASFIVVTLLTVVSSKLLPKALTLRYVVGAATPTSVAILTISSALWPLVWVMNALALQAERIWS
jgi:CBS domain containing-hemolysin-like protein